MLPWTYLGLPNQIVIGPRGLEKNEVEVKKRGEDAKSAMSPDEVINRFTS